MQILLCQNSTTDVRLQMEANDNLVQEKLDNILKLLGNQQVTLTRSPISQHFSRQMYYSTPSRQRRLIEYSEFSSPPDSHSSSMEQYSFINEQYDLNNFGQTSEEQQVLPIQQYPAQYQQIPVQTQQQSTQPLQVAVQAQQLPAPEKQNSTLKQCPAQQQQQLPIQTQQLHTSWHQSKFYHSFHWQHKFQQCSTIQYHFTYHHNQTKINQ